MKSYLNLFTSTFRPCDRDTDNNNIVMHESYAADIYDPELAYDDNGKSYVSNWEVYSQIPYFDSDEWLEDWGI